MTSPDATPRTTDPASRRIVCYYDDDCGMCDAVRRFFEKRDAADRILFIGRGRTDQYLHEVADDLTASTIVVFPPGGRKPLLRTRAVAALVAALPWWWRPLRLAAVPPIVWLSDLAYRLIAANRARISRWCGLNACKLPSATR